MKFHTKQIPPEGRHFEGEDPATILEFNDPGAVPVSPVRYALDVGLSDGGLFATGSIGVDMECRCVGCLEQFVLPLRVNNFACQLELDGREEIDLTEPVREDILLALPAHPRCDAVGGKVCPGVVRENRPSDASSSDEAQAPAVWAALDQLKIR
jgi:uncharacterized metal-binding protein YceD (DUF177 family)